MTFNGENLELLPKLQSNDEIKIDIERLELEAVKLLSESSYTEISKIFEQKISDEENKSKKEKLIWFIKNKEDVQTEKLFSILMFDWYNNNGVFHKSYGLINKLCVLDKNTNIYKFHFRLFEKLFSLLHDDKKYYHVCIKIIYFFCVEFNDEVINSGNTKYEAEDINKLIKLALTIDDLNTMLPILKILMLLCKLEHLIEGSKTKQFDEFISGIHSETFFKYKPLSACLSSYESMIKDCDMDFFKLALLLKQNLVTEFKFGYTDYIKKHKKYFGEFWTIAIKLNAQILYSIAKQNSLMDTMEFLLINTEQSNLKSSIKCTFNKVAEFQGLLDQLNEEDKKLYEEMENFLIKDFCFTENGDAGLKVYKFQEMFINTPKTRRLLFGRSKFENKSLFESVLSIQNWKNESNSEKNVSNLEQELLEVVVYIWNEFRLWDKPEIFVLKNPLQKTPFDYVMDSNMKFYMLSFMMLEISPNFKNMHKISHFMMLKNALFFDYKTNLNKSTENDGNKEDSNNNAASSDDANMKAEGYADIPSNKDRSNQQDNLNSEAKCLVELQMHLIDENSGNDLFNIKNILYFFEELSQYCDASDEKDYFFLDLLENILKEKPQPFSGYNSKELTLPRKHFWIGIMMIYWNYSVEFGFQNDDPKIEKSSSQQLKISEYKVRHLNAKKIEPITFNVQTKMIPFLKLLSMILQKDESKLKEKFSSEYKNIGETLKTVYNINSDYDTKHHSENDGNIFHYYEKYPVNFSFVLLYAAIKTNQKFVVDKIFEYNNFLISVPEFPENMKVEDIHRYVAYMFIENKYELGRKSLPREWISHDFFEKFLNSRITDQAGYYKIDCQFMLPYYNYSNPPEECNDDALMMNEDYDTMEYIINDRGLRPLVKHPVMETIISIKTKKYSLISIVNFLLFFLSYMVPSIMLVYYLHSSPIISKNSDITNSTTGEEISKGFEHGKIQSCNLIRLVFILPRELLQFFCVFKGCKYFKKVSNWIEMGLIFVPIVIFFFIFNLDSNHENNSTFQILTYLEALCIMLMVAAAILYLYPIMKFAIYMKCFKIVFKTYIKIFFILSPLICGCIILTFMMFNRSDKEDMKTFHNLPDAAMKNMIMYFGELAIKPEDILGLIQVIVIIIILIIFISKANLILSIAISDVQQIIDQSKELTMKAFAEKYVTFAKKIRIFYASKIENQESISRPVQLSYKAIKSFIKMYPNIHQLQEVFIDKSSGLVYIDDIELICKTRLPFKDEMIRESRNKIAKLIVKIWDKLFSELKLDEGVRNKIHEILEKRKEELEKKKKKFCEKCGVKILKHLCQNHDKTNDGSAEKNLGQ